MAFKAIFFDAAGTLIKTVRPVGESYALLAKSYGMEVPPEEIRERFRICFSSAPPLAFPGAPPKQLKDLERQWWKELVRRIFEPHGRFAHFDDYFSDLFSYFSKPSSWALYPEAEETLLALGERGFILDVISNFDSRLFGILEGLGIASQFDAIIISSQVGYAKPAAEIFHKALRLHHLKAEEALHIGDSPNKDAGGARNAGLTGVLLDRNGRATSDSFARVRSLKEMVPLIDRQS
ncbi:MAG: HAD-IA family hydrolase [Candidatus Binatia bacterium]